MIAVARDATRDPTLGVPHFAKGKGHQPWTPEQLAFADANFTGMLRRAYMLARYTGQRSSDIVRLGFADIDEGGVPGRPKKDGRSAVVSDLPRVGSRDGDLGKSTRSIPLPGKWAPLQHQPALEDVQCVQEGSSRA